ncbi:MAG: ABC transporter substrate-binding protein [Rhodoferax sp.]
MSVPTLWYSRCPAPTAASIAIRNGWLAEEFAEDGIAVASLAASTDKDVHLSHYLHSQPNSFRFGGYIPPLITRSRGTDVRLVGMSWPDRVSEMVVLADSPIKTAADLKGRRLALPRRVNDAIDWWQATVRLAYDHALASLNLSDRDVTLIDIAIKREYVEDATRGANQGLSLWGARSQFAVQREEAAALIRGEVDAIYTDAAMGALLKASYGFRPVLKFETSEDAPGPKFGTPSVLTVSGALLDEHPDIVVRWIERLLAANAWSQGHPETATQIIARDTGLPEDFVFDAYSPRVLGQLDISLSEQRVALLQQKHDALLVHGFLAKPINFSTFIDPVPLRQAQLAASIRPLEPQLQSRPIPRETTSQQSDSITSTPENHVTP